MIEQMSEIKSCALPFISFIQTCVLDRDGKQIPSASEELQVLLFYLKPDWFCERFDVMESVPDAASHGIGIPNNLVHRDLSLARRTPIALIGLLQDKKKFSPGEREKLLAHRPSAALMFWMMSLHS